MLDKHMCHDNVIATRAYDRISKPRPTIIEPHAIGLIPFFLLNLFSSQTLSLSSQKIPNHYEDKV